MMGSNPPLEQLRFWQRHDQSDRVLEALEGREAACSPQEQAVMALAMAIFTPEKLDTDSPLSASIAEQEPDERDAAWLSDVGAVCLMLGNNDRAVSLLEKAVSLPDATAVEYGRLAAAFLTLNDLEKAREYYQEAVSREPGRAEWHNNLAGISVRQQRLEEALENYDIALRLNPELERARQSRQQVYIALERTGELVAELRESVNQDPDNHESRLNLARAFDLDNRPGEAIKLLRRKMIPIKELPKGTDVSEDDERFNAQFAYRGLLAEILTSRALYGNALMVLNQMEMMAPVNPVPVICRQASCLAESGHHKTALEKLDRLETDFKDNSMIKTVRANILCETGDYEAAETILRDLMEIYPGDATLQTQLGQTLLWVGKLDEASDCFERASQINPMALANLASAKSLPEDPYAIEKMRHLADNPLMPEPARRNMGFALAIVFDRQKNYDTAFHYLSEANRLTDKTLKFNPERFTRKTAAVKKVFNPTFFSKLKPIRKSDRTPVFVVGMPRSGTTLTEQILCSHPEIFGAGELPVIPKLTELMPRVMKAKMGFPWCVLKMTPHLREEAGRHYLYNLYEYDRDHPYVVDKLPHNFVNLGLIAMIFPSARIIHVNRDPRDSAVSNFQQNFKARHSGMGYAFSLKHIARQINDYHKLMSHWRKVLPIPVFDLSYEAMVQDLEGTARQLLDFVGAGWHEDVTRFHETKRAVRTASVVQVRQPIYKTAMKKWKQYEPHLGDLLDNLDSEVIRYWDRYPDENTPYESKIVLQGNVSRFTT